MDTSDRNLELVKLRLSYAWDIFAFHAAQRTMMFNFFLIAVGIVANGVALALRYGLPVYFALVLLGVGAFLSVAFRHLDKRNVQLLEMGEDILRKLERDAVFWGLGSLDGFPNIPLGFLHREAAEKQRMRELSESRETASPNEIEFLKARTGLRYKHGTWIPLIQMTMFGIFLVGMLAASLGQLTSYNQEKSEQIRAIIKQVVAELEARQPTGPQSTESPPIGK